MENNGKGIFYGVIGVATLIVAIIGATFAFLTASANNNVINGAVAEIGLELTVTPVTAEEVNGKTMVPQLSSTIQTAVTGTGGVSCKDGQQNTVCKVYKISVKNDSNAVSRLYGTLSFGTNTVENLKWGLGSSATEGFSEAATYFAKSVSNLVNPTGEGTDYVELEAGATEEYFVVVFIHETGVAQNDPENPTDTGSFTGTVTFSTGTGSGVTSTFTAPAE